MEIRTYTVYKFNELSEDIQEKAIEKLFNVNVDHEWWDLTYDSAEEVGLKITGFDIDRGSYCEGEFMESAEASAHLIEDSHGKQCETYKSAIAYLALRDNCINTAKKDENGDFEDEYQLDQDIDDLDNDFLKSLCEDYRIILSKEYEFLTSEESIKETIESNEYDFDGEGNLA